MQKYSITEIKSKIDIRKNLFTKRKSLVRTQKPAVIGVQRRPSNCALVCTFVQKFRFKLNPFLWGVRKLDILFKLQHLTAKFLTLLSLIKSKKKQTQRFAKKIRCNKSDFWYSIYIFCQSMPPHHVVKPHRHKYTLTYFDPSRLSKTKERPCFNLHIL